MPVLNSDLMLQFCFHITIIDWLVLFWYFKLQFKLDLSYFYNLVQFILILSSVFTFLFQIVFLKLHIIIFFTTIIRFIHLLPLILILTCYFHLCHHFSWVLCDLDFLFLLILLIIFQLCFYHFDFTSINQHKAFCPLSCLI